MGHCGRKNIRISWMFVKTTLVLNYFGQLFSTTGSVAPTWNFLNANQTIIGKMFISNTTAYRGTLRIGLNSNKTTSEISDATVTTPPTYPNLPTMKTDVHKMGSSFIGLGAGIEKRRGMGRLQGIYGADAMLWTSSGSNTYTYGNALSASGTVVTANNATTTNFGTNLSTDTYGNTSRITKDKTGRTLGFGVRAFVGCEYFIASRISLGAEFGWGLGIMMTGSGSSTMESVGGNPSSVGTQEMKTSKTSGMMLDVDRNAFGTGNGALKMNFYF
jgi:hypothetical protein